MWIKTRLGNAMGRAQYQLLNAWIFVGVLVMSGTDVIAQPAGFNYDEAKVPEYQLPDVLTIGQHKITTADQWRQHRSALLDQFARQMYGLSPQPSDKLRFVVASPDQPVWDGLGFRREVTVLFDGSDTGPQMSILIYRPRVTEGPVPVFLGLNFYGNHSIAEDTGITLSKAWMRNSQAHGVVNHQATEASRGTSASRWPVPMILKRGYALATIYCGDIDPDFDDGFSNGVHPLNYRPGQKRPDPDQWGTLSAWAWGLSRAMDYFESAQDLDAKKVAVMGHSRLGKTSLWAGAQDERFALVISNNSGCGGAALSRRRFGETVTRINTSFPHWFCANFKKYNDQEDELPFDQHQLIALIAPRPCYVASAVEDTWADPRGEFLSLYHASPVYKLLGKQGFASAEMPAVDQPLHSDVGYHLRTGKHDVTDFDWKNYLDFADRHFHRSAP